jgi:NADH:ubiquinone oxidoreductase subunit C
MNGKLPAFRVPSQSAHNACKKLKDEGFDYLLFITAVDYLQQNKIEIVYMLGSFIDNRQ